MTACGLRCLATILLLAASAGAPAAEKPPEAQALDFLVGSWRQATRLAASERGPAETGVGRAEYRWGVGDAWLLYDAQFESHGLGAYAVHGLVTYEAKAARYRAWAFNSSGLGLEYEGSWRDKTTLVFDLVRAPDGVRSRVVYAKLADGRVRLTSERSAGGEPFEAYFEALLSR